MGNKNNVVSLAASSLKHSRADLMTDEQMREHVAYLDEQDRAAFEDEALQEHVREQNEYHADEIAYYEKQDERAAELDAKTGNFHKFTLVAQEGVIDETTRFLTVGRDFIEKSGYDLIYFDNMAEEQGIYALEELKNDFHGEIFEGVKGHFYLVMKQDRAQFIPQIDPKEQALQAKKAEQEARKLDKEQIAFVTANRDEINDIYLSTKNFIKAADVFASEQTAHFLGAKQAVITNDRRIRSLNTAAETMLTAHFGYERTKSFVILDRGSAEQERAVFREQFAEIKGFFDQMESTRKMEAFSNRAHNSIFARPAGFVPTEKPKAQPEQPQSRKGVFRRALSAFRKG